GGDYVACADYEPQLSHQRTAHHSRIAAAPAHAVWVELRAGDGVERHQRRVDGALCLVWRFVLEPCNTRDDCWLFDDTVLVLLCTVAARLGFRSQRILRPVSLLETPCRRFAAIACARQRGVCHRRALAG